MTIPVTHTTQQSLQTWPRAWSGCRRCAFAVCTVDCTGHCTNTPDGAAIVGL